MMPPKIHEQNQDLVENKEKYIGKLFRNAAGVFLMMLFAEKVKIDGVDYVSFRFLVENEIRTISGLSYTPWKLYLGFAEEVE